MSQAYFTQQWQRAHQDLNRLIMIEKPRVVKDLPTERAVLFEEISYRYVKYCLIYKNIIECFDNMVHPQKRILMENVLQELTGRIIEMRHELERLSVSEYINLVDTCFDLKVPVDDLELTLSYAHHARKMAKIHQKVVLLDFILHATNVKDEKVAAETFVCTVPEAVLLIQRNQRAYVGRLRAKEVKRKNELRKRLASRQSHAIEDCLNGVIKFQSLWRGYKVRCEMPEIRNQNDVLIGMIMPSDLDPDVLEVQKQTLQTKNYNKALEYEDDYRKDLEVSTETFFETQRDKLVADMRREIRQWILEYHDLMGAFPEYPPEEDGGSRLLFSNKTVEEVEEELNEMGDEKAKAKKDQGKKDKGKDKKGKKDKKDEKKGKKGNPDAAGPFVMMQSKFLDTGVIPNAEEFNKLWLGRGVEGNREQHYDRNLMLEDIHNRAVDIIRLQVDELMRLELESLEHGISRKKAGKPKKAKKGKKGKKEKRGKRKKSKDITEGTPLEDLYKELILSGIVKKVPTVNLKDFIGEVNLMCPKDNVEMEFKHDLGDVRKMIFDYAILPMSSAEVHERVPLRKSLMIVGPHGSGKKMLVNAICTELGANLFDLSPENIQGVYSDAEGQKRLMHLVMKVGKLMEPSIIYIENCDRMFTKKLPPDDNTKPARLKKEFTKALKHITVEDRIMIIGTAKTPFGAAIKPLFKMYERLIFIYPPSSKSRYTLWKRFIEERKGIIPINGFDLTPLAHATSGYTAGDIKNAVYEVISEKRAVRQKKTPLSPTEFVTRLATFDPVFVEELEAFEKWLVKTPLRKKLSILNELEEANEDVLGLL